MANSLLKIINYKYIEFPLSTLAKAYADWRVAATKEEKRAYNKTANVLLTFDDFADASSIHAILRILKAKNVKAAFFLVGDWANKNVNLVDEIRAAGHWIGNHTKSHQNLLKINEKDVREEISGGPSSTLLRPPYGAYNKRIKAIAQEAGYKICYWDIDSDDWQGISPDEIKTRIFRSLHPGACILMHLNAPYTKAVLPSIIEGIRERGYEFCSTGKEIAL